ncbi:hypothetical protein Tco_0483693 [Tanacetum coccineum]
MLEIRMGLCGFGKLLIQHGDGNVVTAPAEGNGNGINETKIAQKEAGIQLTSEEFDFMAVVGAAAKFVRDFKSLAKKADESLAKHKALELEIECLLRAVVSQDIMSIVQNPSVVDSSNLQTELERTKRIDLKNCIHYEENGYAYFGMIVSDQKRHTKSSECEYLSLQSNILGKPPFSSRPKLYAVTPLPNSTAFPKVGETNALSKPVTSNSTPSSHESTVVNNKRVIAPGIFRINLLKLLG